MDCHDDELIPTRQSLLTRLKDWNDQSGWNRFFETYWKLIYRVAVQCGLSAGEAQDVVQETVISVCKSMREGRYDRTRGPFKPWLLQLTRWRILDQVRKRPPAQRALRWEDREPVCVGDVEDLPDPARDALSQVWETEWKRNLLEEGLERVKLKVSATHFQIFDLYAIKQVPLAKVCRFFGVGAGRVYLIKHRVARVLRREIQKLEAQEG